MTFRVWVAILGMAGLLAVGGCDVAKDERLSGAPINDVDENNLDPEDSANVAVFFYLDRPVVGLRYLCSESGRLPISSRTDENGRLVCPRTSKVSFFLGYPSQLKLGEIELSMFGIDGESTARNYVTVTPATLEGTVADASNYRVVNMFNLLTSLEAPMSGTRDVIRISEQVDAAFSNWAYTLSLDSSPSAFAFDLEYVLQQIMGAPGYEGWLRHAGNVLDIAIASALTNESILRARSGVYRTATWMRDSTGTGDEVINARTSLSVSRGGTVNGLATYVVVDSSVAPPVVTADIAPLTNDSQITVTGTLAHGSTAAHGIVFAYPGGDELVIEGNLVNDWLFDLLSTLQDGEDERVPYNYAVDSDHVGQFSFDSGRFRAGADLYPLISNTPTINLDLLPDGYLPRTIGIKYKGYPDGNLVTDVQRSSSSYLAAEPERDMFIRILPSGDIVSDVDFDCAPVTEAAGQVRDVIGNTQEYYIGHVGTIFVDGPEGAETQYISLLLNVYAPAHPDLGFTMGTPSLGTDVLGSVVYDVAKGELRSRSCRPEDDPCDTPVEWFNDVKYFRDVYKAIVEGRLSESQADVISRVNTYFGQVTLDEQVCLLPP